MKTRIYLLLLIMATGADSPYAQSNKATFQEDTVLVNKLLEESKKKVNDAPEEALSIANQALTLSQSIGFLKGEAFALKNIGLVYYYQGKPVPTLDYWTQSLKILQQLQDDIGVANLLSNIGAVYAKRGDDAKALEYHMKSLRLSEKTGNKLRILSSLNNIGSVYFEKKATWDKALEFLIKAVPLAEELKDHKSLGILYENIGEIYFEKGDDAKALTYFTNSLKTPGNEENEPFAYNGMGKVYLRKSNFDLALKYHNKAYDIAKKLNENQIVQSLQGVANVYLQKNDYSSALFNFTKAQAIAESQKDYPDLKELYQQMAVAYSDIKDYASAFKYQRSLDKVKDTLYNEATQKKLGLLTMEFDLQKKEGEITLLTKDNALREAQLKKQKLVKNVFAAGLVMIFFITFIIFRNYQQKVKINKVLDHQKDQIEHLLLNILPAEVAAELQEKGYATSRNYNSASVLFTDFKGFTTIADKMSPEELVKELNNCFIEFDTIIEKYNLEKIKTIGDSYMCAGGIPTPNEGHVYDIVAAGLEIQDYIVRNNVKRVSKDLEPWDVRVGIHVGPVTAGVVGKKKYAYDIWGSTVNIASRMESNGAPGLVNISATTYELIKDRYNCTYRGKIYAKNVGEIDMYFIETGNWDLSQEGSHISAEQQAANSSFSENLI